MAPLLCSPLVPHLDLPGLVSNLITNTSSSSFVYAAIFLKTLAVIRQFIIINSKSHEGKHRLSLVSRTLHNRFTWFNLFVKLVMLCFEDPRESGNFLAVFTVNVLIDYWVTNNFRI